MSLTPGQKSIVENILVGSGDRDDLNAFVKALSGDMVFKTPINTTIVHTTAGWTKDVPISLATVDGEVHTWYQGKVTVSIADTSAAGAATIVGTTLNVVDGKCVVTITGSAAAWLAGENATLTIAPSTILGYTIPTKTFVIAIS